MSSSEDESIRQYFQLLEIFAYGTYTDYKESGLPPLSEAQDLKLKQLTIAALAAQKRTIPYSLLLDSLNIENLRELEDLIIECIYQGLIEGKLDQEKQQLEIDCTIGRDVRIEDIDSMINTLSTWKDKSQVLLEEINLKIMHAQTEDEQIKSQKEAFEKNLEEKKGVIKTSLAEEPEQQMMMDQDFHFMDPSRGPRGRKGRKGRNKHRHM
eukprot:TRINITY_DN4054_c0_g1_i1.p1 TRINITY_DN4054_c0_g1~~TRINITY_DN4054_c0_g1_i1.p1  ORF type:complete len:210 (+),score=54.42 TRINITY_DN4054_c0_g1_i1:96-725(+)